MHYVRFLACAWCMHPDCWEQKEMWLFHCWPAIGSCIRHSRETSANNLVPLQKKLLRRRVCKTRSLVSNPATGFIKAQDARPLLKRVFFACFGRGYRLSHGIMLKHSVTKFVLAMATASVPTPFRLRVGANKPLVTLDIHHFNNS